MTRPHRRRVAGWVAALALLALLGAAPAAFAVDSPVVWAPADSSYGAQKFQALSVPPAPFPGIGSTPFPPGPPPASGVAWGAGFYQPDTATFAFGFRNAVPTAGGLPTLAETELSGTPLVAGTPLVLVFSKAAGQKVDSVAVVGAPDAKVALDHAPAASLTEATRFTVTATVVDPVASASGDVAAAFGLIVDVSADPARDYGGSVFVTDMHWLDVKPPTFTGQGMAGLSASGVNGVKATFDGVFSPAFIAQMGIQDPATVEGYIDVTAATGRPGATFTVLGAGDGALWPATFWKYRITNSSWSKHDILFGRQATAKPGKAVGRAPKGSVRGTRPTFKWKALSGAVTYEVRVFKGKKQLKKKAGITALSWKATKALPRGVYLTWKARGVNTAGAGPWSASLKFKIK
jgi:hypothetical protein